MSVVAAITPSQPAQAAVPVEPSFIRAAALAASQVTPVAPIDDSISISSSFEAQKKAVERAAELAESYRHVPEGISAYEIIQKIQVADASLLANTLVRLRIPVDAAA
ncbi:MAG: hypothetical protein QM674_06160 [Burkholderiaceae bacterium]